MLKSHFDGKKGDVIYKYTDIVPWLEETIKQNINSIEEIVENLIYWNNFKLQYINNWVNNEKTIIENLVKIILSNETTNNQKIKNLKQENENLLEKNKKLQVDKLTWLPNRYKLEDDFIKFENNFEKKWKQFSFAILDIDDFKKINDNYWHLTWDKVLEFFSTFLRDNVIGANSKIYRFWGEEFAILIEEDRKKSSEILNNALEKLNKTPITIRKPWKKDFNIYFTFSWGVSEYWKDSDFDKLYDKADDLLYLVKKNWKNKVISN